MTAPRPSFNDPDYGRLTAYLAARKQQRITLTFTQLEQGILLGALPSGARASSSWWSNTVSDLSPQNRAWLDVGWRVAAFNRIVEMVAFERFDPEDVA
jgi:hypothetical protein